MALVDLNSLQDELQALRQERQKARERLNSMAPRGRGGGPLGGRGRGRGLVGGRDGPNSYSARPLSPSRSERGAPWEGHRAGPPHFDRHDRSEPPRRTVWDRLGSGPPRPQPPGMELEQEVAEVPTRKRISSAVVVESSGAGGDNEEGPGGGSLKRQLSLEADPNPRMKKRNRQLFGALLLGTLNKFREEDEKFRNSAVAQKRMKAEKRAEQKLQEESERLRQQAAEERRQKRQAEVDKLREINLKADLKVLEIIWAKRQARRQLLVNFIQTKTFPPVYWLPAKHNASTAAALAAEETVFEEWKVAEAERLETEKQLVTQRSAAARQAALDRWAAARARRVGSEGAPHEEEDEEGQIDEHAEGVQGELDVEDHDPGQGTQLANGGAVEVSPPDDHVPAAPEEQQEEQQEPQEDKKGDNTTGGDVTMLDETVEGVAQEVGSRDKYRSAGNDVADLLDEDEDDELPQM